MPKRITKREIGLGNRGMSFEQLVEYTNRCYFLKGMADVRKVATPVKVLHGGFR